MNIQDRIVEMTAGMREQANTYANRAADAARDGVGKAADQIEAARTPIDTLADAGFKLNRLSHAYIDRVLSFQSKLLKGTLLGGAQRLRRLARAASLQEAYEGQAIDLAQTRERIVEGATEAMSAEKSARFLPDFPTRARSSASAPE